MWRLQWGGWTVPVWLDVAIVAGSGGLLLAVAAWLFARTD